jgi:hypothetical protein
MRKWLANQYDDIKGHYKWALLVVLFAPLMDAIQHLLGLIPHLPNWAMWTVLSLVSAVAFIWLAKSQKGSGQNALLQSGSASLLVSVAKFDAAKYFLLAYQSPLTQESEANIRTAAAENQPNDKEGFYAKFIGIGLIAYTYDLIWYSIYKSQLRALLELNRKNGLMPLAEIRAHYEQAAISNPDFYRGYTFEQWLGYMKAQPLFIVHPSDMVEITLRGKDFLKYLLHYGRDDSQRGL